MSDTFANLKRDIKEELDEETPDTVIESKIKLVESRLNRVLRTMDMEGTTTVTASSGTATTALPSDFRKLVSIQIQSDPERNPKYMDPQRFAERVDPDSSGVPEFYTFEGDNFKWGPIPDANYTVNLAYYQDIPALNSSNTTNWITNNYPDLYFYGVLSHLQKYASDNQEAAIWKQLWEESIRELQVAGIKRRHPGPLQIRPAVNEKVKEVVRKGS